MFSLSMDHFKDSSTDLCLICTYFVGKTVLLVLEVYLMSVFGPLSFK